MIQFRLNISYDPEFDEIEVTTVDDGITDTINEGIDYDRSNTDDIRDWCFEKLDDYLRYMYRVLREERGK